MKNNFQSNEKKFSIHLPETINTKKNILQNAYCLDISIRFSCFNIKSIRSSSAKPNLYSILKWSVTGSTKLLLLKT